MHITLINPPSLMAAWNYSTISHPPIGLAAIAAYLQQQGHTITLIDAVGEGISQYRDFPAAIGFILQGLSHLEIAEKIPANTDLIGVSCMFSHAWVSTRQLIHSIADRFPKAFLVAGGEHATALYDFCLKETPLGACALGEGEETMADLACALENKSDVTTVAGLACRMPDQTVVVTNPRDRIAKLNDLPFPAWDQVPLSAYTIYEGPASGPTMPMLATRGCPHDCTFCSAPGMWGRTWYARNPEHIVKEMEYHIRTKQVTAFQFPDINPFINRHWTRALCRLIIQKKLSVTWQMPVGTGFQAIDAKTARLLVAAGCDQIQYAPESGSPAVLSAMNKKIDIDAFKKATGMALAANMRVSVLFIIGYPGETLKDVQKTFSLIRRLAVMGVHEIAISSFVPLPGTAVFEMLLEQRQITVNDEYLISMASATSLFSTCSWNSRMGGRSLLILKWLGLMQFFMISWAVYPKRLFERFFNLLSGKQQTKADRVLREMVNKRKIMRRLNHQQNNRERLHN
ncbi:MAG: radical SAM protein [Thermodesulfobacteriota bacterium]|nr:radical SAM protein [Thermodesulfobacteriota bacterium]